MDNPSHMSKSDVGRILAHWRDRQACGKVPLKFQGIQVQGEVCRPQYPSGLKKPLPTPDHQPERLPSPPPPAANRLNKQDKVVVMGHLADVVTSGEETELNEWRSRHKKNNTVAKKKSAGHKQPRRKQTTPVDSDSRSDRAQNIFHSTTHAGHESNPLESDMRSTRVSQRLSARQRVIHDSDEDDEEPGTQHQAPQSDRREDDEPVHVHTTRSTNRKSGNVKTDSKDGSDDNASNNSGKLSLTDEPSNTITTWQRGNMPTTKQLYKFMSEQDRRHELRKAKWKGLDEESQAAWAYPRRSPALEISYIRADGSICRHEVPMQWPTLSESRTGVKWRASTFPRGSDSNDGDDIL